MDPTRNRPARRMPGARRGGVRWPARASFRSSGARCTCLVWVILGAVAVGASAGCDSDAAPPVTSTPSVTASSASPSASATASPSPSASSTVDIPQAARAKSRKGAEAFARFYVQQSALAWMRPDASLLDGLSTKKCATCQNLYETAKTLEAQGQRYDSTPIKAGEFEVFRSTDNSYVFDVALEEQSVKVLNASGEVVKELPKRQLKSAVAVVWQEGQWFVDAIGE